MTQGRDEGEGRSGRTALHSGEEKGEIENGFEALYGVMMLRLQKKEISAETSAAVGSIARWIGMLSEYEKQEKKGEVEF